MNRKDANLALHKKAEEGDVTALAAVALSWRLSDMEDKLMAIDGVLTEIRRAIEERQ